MSGWRWWRPSTASGRARRLATWPRPTACGPEQVRELANHLPYAFWARIEPRREGAERRIRLRRAAQAPTRSSHRPCFDRGRSAAQAAAPSLRPSGRVIVVRPGRSPTWCRACVPAARAMVITQIDLRVGRGAGAGQDRPARHPRADRAGRRGRVHPVRRALPTTAARWRCSTQLPAEDPETSRRVESGGTIGCFQIESPGMRATLREIHARTRGRPDGGAGALPSRSAAAAG